MNSSEKSAPFFKKFWFLVAEVVQRFSSDQGAIYSAYLAFYLLLSVFPFLMAIVGIMGFIPFELDEALIRLIEFFPVEVHTYLKNFIMSNRRNSDLLGYSVLFLLWSSARAVGAIRKALDRISGGRSRHNFIKARLFDALKNFAFIFLLLLILIIPTAVKLTRLGTLFLKIKLPTSLDFFESFQWVFVFGMLFIVITFVYMRMGTKKYPFRDIRVGALLTAVGWALMSYLFNGVITLASNFIHGVFNTVIALLIWFQINMNIFLVGAHLNQILLEKRINHD